jgi:butyrate response factor 1
MSEKKSKSSNTTVKVSFSADKKKSRKLKKNALQEVNILEEYKNDPKYKTELCKSFTETSFCMYGNKCRFAHGKHELFEKTINHPKYKQKNCLSYFQNGYCIYGPNCHFKHNEKKINQTNRTYYTYLLNLIELNLNEKVKNYDIKFFDEDEFYESESFKSSNSSVSSDKEKMPLILNELIEDKLRSQIKRLPVFTKISRDETLFQAERL